MTWHDAPALCWMGNDGAVDETERRMIEYAYKKRGLIILIGMADNHEGNRSWSRKIFIRIISGELYLASKFPGYDFPIWGR